MGSGQTEFQLNASQKQSNVAKFPPGGLRICMPDPGRADHFISACADDFFLLKDEMAILNTRSNLFPITQAFDNYRQLKENFPLYILNSLKVTGIIVFVLNSYRHHRRLCFCEIKMVRTDLVFLFYIGSLMIPIHVYIIPQFILVRRLGLYDSHWALVCVVIYSFRNVFNETILYDDSLILWLKRRKLTAQATSKFSQALSCPCPSR